MQVQLSIRLILRKLGKGRDRNVNPLAELISVPVEDNKDVFRQAKTLPCFCLALGIELTGSYAVGNDSDWLLDAALNKFVRTKFRIGNDRIPLIGSLIQRTQPVIGVHGGITHELKLLLLVQIFDLVVLIIDNPHVVNGEYDIGLLTLNDLSNPFHTERLLLESVGRRIHAKTLLQFARIPPPVIAKNHNFEVIV